MTVDPYAEARDYADDLVTTHDQAMAVLDRLADFGAPSALRPPHIPRPDLSSDSRRRTEEHFPRGGVGAQQKPVGSGPAHQGGGAELGVAAGEDERRARRTLYAHRSGTVENVTPYLDVEHAIDDVCRRCEGSGWNRAPFGAAGNCEPCNGSGRTYPLHNRTEAA